jgi:hypothetical protein
VDGRLVAEISVSVRATCESVIELASQPMTDAVLRIFANLRNQVLTSGWATHDTAGTLRARASHRSKPVRAAHGLGGYVVPALDLQIFFRERVGTLWDDTSSSLQSIQCRNFAEQLDAAPRSRVGKQS